MTQELGILSCHQAWRARHHRDRRRPDRHMDPMKKAMRQIAGAFAELEKARLVSKLRGARERKKALTGKCEGKKYMPSVARKVKNS